MSLSFSLVCDETRQRIWIGQGHHDPEQDYEPVMDTLYSGEAKTMEALRRFLNETRGKPLRFVVDDYPENEHTLEYTDVQRNQPTIGERT